MLPCRLTLMRGEPICLCTMQELVGDADDERAADQMALLAAILGKLGYQLMSGEAPQFHELWAGPLDPMPAVESDSPRPRAHDIAAEAFERRFLAWLQVSFGVVPAPEQGTNAAYWRFWNGTSEVAFGVVGRQQNTGKPAAASTEWLLRIEEDEPTDFIARVEGYFSPGSAVRRRMPNGRIRVQFKSGNLTQEFIDQTDQTDSR